jgi:hypothetical protein
MSEAEEQAAKWRIIEEHKASRQRLAAITQQADEYVQNLEKVQLRDGLDDFRQAVSHHGLVNAVCVMAFSHIRGPC